MSEYENSLFSMIPAILIGISFALINRIDSSKLYSVSLAAINFWLFLAFEIDKLNFEFSSFELILSKS